MAEQSGFDFSPIKGRSMVQLRVRPAGAESACKALEFPDQALRWRGKDPAIHWLGPDLWLFTSDTKPAGDIVKHIDSALTGQLHGATDMSSSLVCFALRGRGARTLLAMGCGIDMHDSVFMTGHCARTHFAGVLLFIVANHDDDFDLYFDRSLARYLGDWITDAGNDPLVDDLKLTQNCTERT